MNTLNQTMKIVGWTGTLFAGAVAAKGLGEFLPASKSLVWALGGALEVMNIVGLAWLSGGHRAHNALRVVMGVLCAVVVLLDVVGVVGQLSSGHQAKVNALNASAGQAAATIDAQIDAARQGVASIDVQIKAVDDQIAAAGAAKIAAGRNKGRAAAADKAMHDARMQRDAMQARRDAAQDKVTALEVDMAAAKGRAINAASEFAAVEFVGALFGITPDAVANALIATFGALLTLFSVVMMLAAGHGPAHATAPVPGEKAPVPSEGAAPKARAQEHTPELDFTDTPEFREAVEAAVKEHAKRRAVQRGQETKRRNKRNRDKARTTGPQLRVNN